MRFEAGPAMQSSLHRIDVRRCAQDAGFASAALWLLVQTIIPRDQFTVIEKVVVCCSVPAVAVTVTIDVTG